MSIARLFILFMTLVLVSAVMRSQVASTADLKGGSGQNALYAHTAVSIAKANPAVSQQTLNEDLVVIKCAERKLRERYPNTFSNSDVQQITAYAWADFRERQANEPLNVDAFAKLASESYGGLKITSTPDGAEIEIDSKPWNDRTDANGLCRTGTRNIKLSKPGYKSEVGVAIVNEGKWTLFHRDLKKN